MAQPDVIVVGGGVIGAACARALAATGRAIEMIEGGPKPGTSSAAAAGMLAPLAEAPSEHPLLGLAVRARDLYHDLAPTLLDETGIDIGLWSQGILEVAFSEEEVARKKSEVAWQRQSGYTAEWLSDEEVRELAPTVSPEVLGAAFAPEDGALDPLALLDALVQGAESHGATVRRGEPVDEVVVEDDRAVGVLTRSGVSRAGAVLLAAGSWSGRIGGLKRPLSVEPLRGQITALEWPGGDSAAVIYGAGGYVLRRGDEAVVGSTMEHAGFDTSVTKEGLAHLNGIARRIYPSLERAKARRTWAGLRPCTPDGCPIIGRDPEVADLWYATGHGRNGILLAVYTGELIASLFAGEEVELDLACVVPDRFWHWYQ